MPWSLKPFANLLPWGGGALPADDLYDAIMAQARLPIYYQRLGVPDTLEGRFSILTLHLFAVFRRLKGGGPEAASMAQALSERFVADMDTVLREIGVGDLKVPQKVRKLVAGGASLIDGYNRALTAGGDALQSAIAESLPLEPEEANAASAKLMPYVDAMLQSLNEQPLKDICAGKVRFPSVSGE
ncbi:MAG: ubiquinol-cytochrome C chaperone family protein [Methyloceanibacter sp.]|nr:ubiquinol-cytochrome C chaperone family protein [Methyloceanibacter sp.]